MKGILFEISPGSSPGALNRRETSLNNFKIALKRKNMCEKWFFDMNGFFYEKSFFTKSEIEDLIKEDKIEELSKKLIFKIFYDIERVCLDLQEVL